MIELTTKAQEKGTYIITLTFTDSEGNAVTPNECTYSLLDSNGSVINGKEDEVLTPAATISIVLYGADLEVTDDLKDLYRYVTIKATYDSSTYGNNLPLNEEARFEITPFIGVE